MATCAPEPATVTCERCGITVERAKLMLPYRCISRRCPIKPAAVYALEPALLEREDL